MIGAPDDEDTVIVLEPINLIEEVAAHLVCHERVEILEDQVARCRLPRQAKDLADGSLGAAPLNSLADDQRQ